MDFYRLLKLFGKLKSPKARLLGLYVMHTARRRYIGIYLDPVLSCNFRCKMCYFSDEEKRKEMHGILSEQDMETIAKALFHHALKLQIGCGAEPSLYKNLTGIVRLGKQYNVPYISLTTNGNLLTKEQLFSMAEAGLDEITLSTHGIRKETYEHLMTNGKYDLFLQLLDNLNSAVFFLVRKFYMLRCLFGTLYVDMRCFGVSWFFSKHKIPHPNQWGILRFIRHFE